MNSKIVLVLLSLCLTAGIAANYSKMILKAGTIQLEKAKEVAEQYQARTKYLDSLLDEM